MAPWFAALAKEAQKKGFNKPYTRMGAVLSVEFRGVDRRGGDVYEVHLERGTATWTIWLGANGIIEDADNHIW